MANRENYISWLMDIANCGKEYSRLFNLMLDRDFCPYIGNDDNRAEDGLDLRYEFEEEFGVVRELVGRPCSELEMFLALAKRCERDLMADYCADDQTEKWFWSMLNSVGIGRCVNKGFNTTYCERILDRFENRNYNSDGSNGGPFVVECPREDLRNVEIWYQMLWFLGQNYDF